MAVRRRSIHPGQFSLVLGDEPAPADDGAEEGGVFFVVMPPPAVARMVADFGTVARRRHGLWGRLRPTRVLHVSLLGLGKYNELSGDFIERAKRTASTVRMWPFTVAFDRLLSLQNLDRSPLVVAGGDGVVGLVELYRSIAAVFGVPEQEKFLPHMTLLYDRQPVGQVLLDEPLTWPVTEFLLVRSRYGEGRYEVLGRWPLQADRLAS